MWDVLVRTPRGRTNPRKFSMLLATFLMAVFGYTSLVSTPVNAAKDGWNGDNIVFDGNTYKPTPSGTTLPVDIPQGVASYQFTDTSKTPNLVHIIYFSQGVDNPKSSKEATYIRYTLNPPNELINPTGEKKIALTPSEPTPTPNTDESVVSSSCTIDGIGYIVCPLMNGIAEGMDFIYEKIRGFLVVQPISTSVDNPVYRIWMYSRDLANVAFIIGFLIIIYSYLVGGGFSGYEIRKIIPRLVIAAILINISYILCSIAVDISNIAGYGVTSLFENVRDNILPGSSAGDAFNWKNVTAWVLAGGTGAAVGALALPAAVGGAAGGLWFMLAPFLLGGALVVMVTFLILAARQAIIVIAIAIAPLAFAAYILPNTEKWFERWRSLFFTMLVMFPAFGAVFGGAQLAGDLIIRTAAANGKVEQVILGLGVMVAPLAITPLLLKLGGGILNRIGGIVNNQQKGIYDRYKNYNKERLADHVAKNNRRNAEMRANGAFGRRQFMRRRAAYDYAKKNYRENQRKFDDEAAQNSWHTQTGRWGYDSQGTRDQRSSITKLRQDGHGSLDTYKRDNQLRHNQIEAHHDEHWQHLLQTDAARRGMLTDTRLTEGRSKVVSGAMEAQDERALQTALNEASTPQYAHLRAMKVQTSVDSGVAEIQKAAMEAAGKLALSNTVNNDRALTNMKVETFTVSKQAEVIDNTIQKTAERAWDNQSRTNAALQQLRLREVQATDQAKLAQEQWNTLVENIAAKGAAAPNLVAGTAAVADSIRNLRTDTQIEAYAQESAKREIQTSMSTAFKTDATLRARAGGVGGDKAATRIYAKAKKDIVGAYLEDVENSRSLLSEYSLVELMKLHQQGKDRDNVDVSGNDALRDAAMREIVLTKGNNWAFQKTKDYVANLGMNYDEDDNKYYEVVRDADGFVERGPDGKLLKGREITDSDEIERRRDIEQLFVDSAGKSKLKIANFSGTDRGNAETGTFFLDSKETIARDIRDKKINATRLAGTDVDELQRMVQIFRSDSIRKKIGADARASLAKTIKFALDDPQVRANIGDREAELMEVISKYASDGRAVIPLSDQVTYESHAKTKAPYNYQSNRVMDFEDGLGANGQM